MINRITLLLFIGLAWGQDDSYLTQKSKAEESIVKDIRHALSSRGLDDDKFVVNVDVQLNNSTIKLMKISLILPTGVAPELIENIRQLTMESSKFVPERGDKLTVKSVSFKERSGVLSPQQQRLKNIAEEIDRIQKREIDNKKIVFRDFMLGSWSAKSGNDESVLDFTRDSLFQYDIIEGEINILGRDKIIYLNDNRIKVENKGEFLIKKTGNNLIQMSMGDNKLPVMRRVLGERNND
jgi:hypothetical protein